MRSPSAIGVAVDAGGELAQSQDLHSSTFNVTAFRQNCSQEADVVGDELADVVEAVTLLGQPVDAEPEGEARPLLGVEPAGAQHVRVDHPAAAQLDPAADGVDMSNSADGSVNGK